MMKLISVFLLTYVSAAAQLPVIVHEKFDVNNYGWYEINRPPLRVSFSRGKYLIDAPDGGWMSYIAPYVDPDKDFYIEASFTQLDGDTDNSVGLIWGHDGENHMNSFTVTAGGYYRIGCSDRTLQVSDKWRKK